MFPSGESWGLLLSFLNLAVPQGPCVTKATGDGGHRGCCWEGADRVGSHRAELLWVRGRELRSPWLCRGDRGRLGEEEGTQASCKQYHRSWLERSLLQFSRLRQVKETRQTQGVPSPPSPPHFWKSGGQQFSAQAVESLPCCTDTDPPAINFLTLSEYALYL